MTDAAVAKDGDHGFCFGGKVRRANRHGRRTLCNRGAPHQICECQTCDAAAGASEQMSSGQKSIRHGMYTNSFMFKTAWQKSSRPWSSPRMKATAVSVSALVGGRLTASW